MITLRQNRYEAPDNGADYALAGLEGANYLLTALWSSLAFSNVTYIGRYFGILFSLASSSLLAVIITLSGCVLLSLSYAFLRYREQTAHHPQKMQASLIAHLNANPEFKKVMEFIIHQKFYSRYGIDYLYGENGEIISFELSDTQSMLQITQPETGASHKTKKRLLTLLNLYLMGYWVIWVISTFVMPHLSILAVASGSFLATIEVMVTPFVSFGIPLILPIVYMGGLLYCWWFNPDRILAKNIEKDKIQLLKYAAIELLHETKIKEPQQTHASHFFDLKQIIKQHKETNPKINFILGFAEGFSFGTFSYWVFSTVFAYFIKTSSVALGIGMGTTLFAGVFSILLGLKFAYDAYAFACAQKDVWKGTLRLADFIQEKISLVADDLPLDQSDMLQTAFDFIYCESNLHNSKKIAFLKKLFISEFSNIEQRKVVKEIIFSYINPLLNETDEKLLNELILKEKLDEERRDHKNRIDVLSAEVSRLQYQLDRVVDFNPREATAILSGLAKYDAQFNHSSPPPPASFHISTSLIARTITSAIVIAAFLLEFSGDFFPLALFGVDIGLVILGAMLVFSFIYLILDNYQQQHSRTLEYTDALLSDLEIRRHDLEKQKTLLTTLIHTKSREYELQSIYPPLFAKPTSTDKENENEHLVHADYIRYIE